MFVRWATSKKPTRYRAKAGPEVVLRKVSVLFTISSMPKRAIKADRAKSFWEGYPPFFAIDSMPKRAIKADRAKSFWERYPSFFAISYLPKRAIGRRTESFSERTILFTLNLLCRKRARGNTGKVVLRRASALFRLSQVPHFLTVLHNY